MFANELTDLLGVERPLPAFSDGSHDHYRFERPIVFKLGDTTMPKRIDLYRKGCFVMEAKQSSKRQERAQKAKNTEANKGQKGHAVRGTAKWDTVMREALRQGDRYAREMAREDGWPPFILVVDVGNVIELHADFSRQGQGYTQFPDTNRYRIRLEDLHDEKVRARLTAIWEDPYSLDPAAQSAKVTREIAAYLAELGKSFEAQGHESQKVARFLMRCLFTMFAEDVALIPKDSFTNKLKELRGHPEHAKPALEGLWEVMDKGGFSQILMTDLLRFNGGLFKESDALPLDGMQLGLLISAAEADWQQVEPAIFGTLLERALDKKQRHKLGAHYTPRAYVERLIIPTIMEPLRDDWMNVQAAVQTLSDQGKDEEAIDQVRAFHDKLCQTRVLDPACGSGNFLYVALEMMKRLEGEVIAALAELGDQQQRLITIDPHQFLGIELNPWAANVAELVLWIGFLQWHFRTHGTAAPSEPVLQDFKNIENRDAILDWDKQTPRLDADGKPVTRWDGITTITHMVTGEQVPDPDARIQVYDYGSPKATKWPEAEFIVGNPPFIGNKRMREALGDGYVEALWQAYPKVPQSADLVMFWWEKAALIVRNFVAKSQKGTRRFGLITTNSLRQTFNRRVLEPHLNESKKTLSLLFAIPDHPWVDSADGAAVRIAMTVAGRGKFKGELSQINNEKKTTKSENGVEVQLKTTIGKIFANLRTGADVTSTTQLIANERIAYQGVIPGGIGFRVDENQKIDQWQILRASGILKRYLNGQMLINGSDPIFIIDFFGLDETIAREQAPQLYQQVKDLVKPERDNVKRETRRKNWWLYAEPNSTMRPMFKEIGRYIATCRTAKHRIFSFVEADVLPDAKIIAIGVQ